MLTRSEVEKFIENFESPIGDRGEDLFKVSTPKKTDYAWSADVNGNIEDIDCTVTDIDIQSDGQSRNLKDLTEETLSEFLNDSLFCC